MRYMVLLAIVLVVLAPYLEAWLYALLGYLVFLGAYALWRGRWNGRF